MARTARFRVARVADEDELGVEAERPQREARLQLRHAHAADAHLGAAGNTEAGRPSHRYGVEWTNYYSPRPWLTFDLDLSLSSARFTDADPAGDVVPGAVSTVLQGGVTVDSVKHLFGSVRWRYFGPRALIEDDSVRSKATSLVNLEAGYKFSRSLRLAVDVFNLLDAKHSDIDYFYASRLPGEPAEGIDDFHLHPALPRTARVSLIVGF